MSQLVILQTQDLLIEFNQTIYGLSDLSIEDKDIISVALMCTTYSPNDVDDYRDVLIGKYISTLALNVSESETLHGAILKLVLEFQLRLQRSGHETVGKTIELDHVIEDDIFVKIG